MTTLQLNNETIKNTLNFLELLVEEDSEADKEQVVEAIGEIKTAIITETIQGVHSVTSEDSEEVWLTGRVSQYTKETFLMACKDVIKEDHKGVRFNFKDLYKGKQRYQSTKKNVVSMYQ